MYSVDDYANACVCVCVHALYDDLRSTIDVIMRDQFHSINCQYMSANGGTDILHELNSCSHTHTLSRAHTQLQCRLFGQF